MHADEQAIRDLVQTWLKASAGGDLDQVLALMSDDVVFLTPGQEPFGKQEFATASRTDRPDREQDEHREAEKPRAGRAPPRRKRSGTHHGSFLVEIRADRPLPRNADYSWNSSGAN